MPELPEVETTLRGVEPHLREQTIARFDVRNSQLRWPVPASISEYHGARIERLYRRGKYLVVTTTVGDLLLHLGMSGSLRICDAEEPPMAHDHIDMVLSNGRAMRYRDPRRFGAYLPTNDALAHPLLSSLGPEPLADTFTAAHLYQVSRGKTRKVKQFLMDSHVVVGVGNIYANEALFMAGVRPTTQAGRVGLARYEKLVEAVKEVLAKAIQAGGTTLQDFVDSEGKPGYFKNELFVYGREGLPCLQCGTVLSQIRLDNRTTVFCKQCQR